jgi:hypothetical protein
MPGPGYRPKNRNADGKSMLEIYADGKAGWVAGKPNPYHNHDIGYGIWECGWMDARRTIGRPGAGSATTGEPA